MDLSKAFDTIVHDMLLNKLNYYGINATELQWFRSYLTNRSQYVEIDSVKSSSKNITTWVPQGSILGPLFFLIYIHAIPECSSLFSFLLYADDTSLVSHININDGDSSNSPISIINTELVKVNDWLAVNKLSLNVNKTKYMFFRKCQKASLDLSPRLIISGTNIERVKTSIC